MLRLLLALLQRARRPRILTTPATRRPSLALQLRETLLPPSRAEPVTPRKTSNLTLKPRTNLASCSRPRPHARLGRHARGRGAAADNGVNDALKPVCFTSWDEGKRPRSFLPARWIDRRCKSVLRGDTYTKQVAAVSPIHRGRGRAAEASGTFAGAR